MQTLVGRQVFYDASAGEFHNFILPPRNLHCAVCGDIPTIRSMAQCGEFLKKGSADSKTGGGSSSDGSGSTGSGGLQNCSTSCAITINPTTTATATTNSITHITPLAYYQDVCVSGTRHIVLDVRSDVQFAMVSFEWYQQSEALNETQKPTLPSHTITTTTTTRQQMIDTIVQSAVIVHIPLHQLKQLTMTVNANSTDNNNHNNNSSTKPLHNVITSLFTKQIKQTDKNGTQNGSHNTDSETALDQPLPPIYVLCRRGVDSITGFITLTYLNEP